MWRNPKDHVTVPTPQSSRLAVVVIAAGDESSVDFLYELFTEGTIVGQRRDPAIGVHCGMSLPLERVRRSSRVAFTFSAMSNSRSVKSAPSMREVPATSRLS